MMKDTVRAWLQKAERDLQAAKDLLQHAEPVTDAICFHSQQCAEKYLKAFLIFHQKEVPRTHNIAWLILQCAEIHSDFLELLQGDVPLLTTYAVEVRYPDFEPDLFPTVTEAQHAVELAEEVKAFVLSKLGEQ